MLHGSCRPHVLLTEAWRACPGVTQKINVEAYVEGIVFLDLLDLGPQYNTLQLVVEVSRDTQRWADLVRSVHYDRKGYYQLPVTNVGAYLRVSYDLPHAARFSLEWLGKFYTVGGSPT